MHYNKKESLRNDLAVYARKVGLDGRLEYDCNSIDEIDTLKRCQIIIEDCRDAYFHAINVAPKDPKRVESKLIKMNADEDLLTEYRAIEPWYSNAENIRKVAMSDIKEILTFKNIGINRQDKLLATIALILREEPEREELTTAQLEFVQKITNW